VKLGHAFAGTGLAIRPTVSTQSLLVSFSLGMLVTFATVLFSANRVSHLNIVSAIRDLPQPPRPPSYLRDRLLAPFRAIANGFRALFHLRIFRALRAWLIGLPGSLLRLVWFGFTSGPLTLLLGLLLVPLGEAMSAGPETASPAGVRLGSLVVDADATNAVQTLVFCLGAVMFYVLLYRSRIVPRWIAVWGLVAIPVYVVADLLAMYSVVGANSSQQVLMFMPLAVQEMVLAVWMIARGFRPPAVPTTSEVRDGTLVGG